MALSGFGVSGAAAEPLGAGPGGASGNSEAAKACQKGGFMEVVGSDGTTFASQGECTSFAAQGGQLQPKLAPAPTAQQICEEAGGTFAVGDGNPIVFSCTIAGTFSEATVQALRERCGADGGNTFIVNANADRARCLILSTDA